MLVRRSVLSSSLLIAALAACGSGQGNDNGGAGAGGSVGSGGSSASGGAANEGTGGSTQPNNGSDSSSGGTSNTGGGTPVDDGGTPPGNDASTCTPAAVDPGPNASGMPLKPFPQHVGYPGCPTCIHPTVPQDQMDADIATFYDGWKTLIQTFNTGDVSGSRYISAGANGDIKGWGAGVEAVTQSEGHGYAMLIVALMAGHDPEAKTLFDSLNGLRKKFPSSSDPRLMSWALPSSGKISEAPQPPATDGDMDMGYALLLAYDQWGDEAKNHYLADANSVIAGMREKFIDMGNGEYFPRLNTGDPAHMGSVAPESKPNLTRPSDYMTDHMLTFAHATGDKVWADLATGSMNILKHVRNDTTGLVPDFIVDDPPVPSTTGTGDEGLCYACYDGNSCRVPWRQAVGVAHYGFDGSMDVAKKMMTWARTTTNDTPAQFGAGFNLDGTNGGKGDPSFTSPMIAAGITDSAAQKWLDNGWTYMKGVESSRYYGGSITLMSMLVVSGNWWIPSGGVGTCP